jgi:hypothetical protein
MKDISTVALTPPTFKKWLNYSGILSHFVRLVTQVTFVLVTRRNVLARAKCGNFSTLIYQCYVKTSREVRFFFSALLECLFGSAARSCVASKSHK